MEESSYRPPSSPELGCEQAQGQADRQKLQMSLARGRSISEKAAEMRTWALHMSQEMAKGRAVHLPLEE